MTISEGVKPVDHRNLKAWVCSLLVNLKTKRTKLVGIKQIWTPDVMQVLWGKPMHRKN